MSESIRSMQAFFDHLAPTWDDNEADAPRRAELVARMRLPAHGVVADIGCGRGVMTGPLLAADPRQILAIDLSGEMIAYAQRRYEHEPRVRCLHGDLLTLELPPLDAAVLYNAYPHFLDKGALAAKLAALVRPGGVVVVAHSVGRAGINARHRDGLPFQLSVPLRAPEQEAAEFAPHFLLDETVDTPQRFFLRLTRRDD